MSLDSTGMKPTATAISELWLTRKSSVEVRVQSVLAEAVHTCSDADHHSQALTSSPHDDGSQDLAPQQAVLDASSEGVEALVAQHGHLIMKGKSFSNSSAIEIYCDGPKHFQYSTSSLAQQETVFGNPASQSQNLSLSSPDGGTAGGNTEAKSQAADAG
ncbi:hypothetical protein Nmel_018711 [Mimus melanotis]